MLDSCKNTSHIQDIDKHLDGVGNILKFIALDVIPKSQYMAHQKSFWSEIL